MCIMLCTHDFMVTARAAACHTFTIRADVPLGGLVQFRLVQSVCVCNTGGDDMIYDES